MSWQPLQETPYVLTTSVHRPVLVRPLRMLLSDVATTAKVSIASIYQYYPNKQAIVAALASHYSEVFSEHTIEVLKEIPDDLDALWQLTLQLAYDSYHFHRDDLVVRDIWAGSSTDKALQGVKEKDSTMQLEFYFNQSKHLFKPSKHEKAKVALSLLIDFAKCALYQAVELDEEAGEQKNEGSYGTINLQLGTVD